MTDLCPVCGKGDLVDVGLPQRRRVSHLDCVKHLDRHVTNLAGRCEVLQQRAEQTEAELAKMTTVKNEGLWLAWKKAEAELAALKARRCEICNHGEVSARDGVADGDVYCGYHSSWWQEDQFCSEWETRP